MRVSEIEERIRNAEELLTSLRNELQQAKAAEIFNRVPEGESYYTVFLNIYGAVTENNIDDYDPWDDTAVENNNYFRSEERACQVADKISYLLLIERVHDIFCPDYTPNWDTNENKYFVMYNHTDRKYTETMTRQNQNLTQTYFPDRATAQRACDYLNTHYNFWEEE